MEKEGNSKLGWLLFAIAGCGCLLVGTAVAGIVAAIVVPNFVDATQKAKQKRTVGDIRNLGTAWMAFATDQVVGDAAPVALEPGELGAGELRALLVPGYLAEMPEADGWGHPFALTLVETAEGTGLPALRIRSPGRDGAFEAAPDADAPVAYDTFEYDRDIVWQDGVFIQYPQSVAGPP
jgi:hypothetical protein